MHRSRSGHNENAIIEWDFLESITKHFVLHVWGIEAQNRREIAGKVGQNLMKHSSIQFVLCRYKFMNLDPVVGVCLCTK